MGELAKGNGVKRKYLVVEHSLGQVSSRWKKIHFLARSCWLWMGVCLAVLGLGGLMRGGYLAGLGEVNAALTILGILTIFSWLMILFRVVTRAPSKARLAEDLEGTDRRLMDRMNTLVHLGDAGKIAGAVAEGFSRRIARQVQHLFARKKAPSVYSYWQVLPGLVALVAAATGMTWYWARYLPWQTIQELQRAAIERSASMAPPDAAQAELPEGTTAEERKRWGEVRITDPGTDLRVTKVDLVPLQIEAAASEAIKRVEWFTSGRSEEPRIASAGGTAIRGVFAGDAVGGVWGVGLGCFDLLRPGAGGGDEPVFVGGVFLEVRPFKEDLVKMPGGEGGKAYQWLNELTGLIQEQQRVIRDTHRLSQRGLGMDDSRTNSPQELAEREKELSDAARHLAAKIHGELRTQGLVDVDDHLGFAQKALKEAENSLNRDELKDAQLRERLALSDLAAARKLFQKAVVEHPDRFEEPREMAPAAAQRDQALKQMAEFRDEAKAARDFVDRTRQEQRNLQMKYITQQRTNQAQLVAEQKALREALKDFEEQHPEPFKQSEAQMQEALKNMEKGAQDMQSRNSRCISTLGEAATSLEKLTASMDKQMAGEKLAEAYRLKEMLDREAGELEQASAAGSGAQREEIAKTAGQARQTLDRLQQLMNQEPTQSAFDTPVREALSPEKTGALDRQLAQVEQQRDLAQQKRAAGGACNGLKQVSEAFSKSEPQLIQAGRSSSSMNQGEQDGMTTGLRELDSLAQRMEKGQAPNRGDQAKQARQALKNIRSGMAERDRGFNEPGNQVFTELDKLEKKLSEEQRPLDLAELKRLLDQLRRFSVEMSSQAVETNATPVVNIDTARVPPAYRGRIQKYFEKLSEK